MRNDSFMIKKILLSVCFILSFVTVSAWAYQEFIIKQINVEGLEGISRETVLSYLPIKVGDALTPQKSQQIIAALYKTDFFDNINLARSNNTLIIRVVQRPIIGRITVSGNEDIPTKKLKESLKKMNFAEGDSYNPSVLDKIKGALESEYFMAGKYNARVSISVKKQARNRVAVTINISEGKVSKIHQIKIIGNVAFSQSELLKQFKLTTAGLFTFIRHNDQYSREKLTRDLEALRSYYMDRGYIKFKINSTQVLLSPDHKQVYLVIAISEGGQYRISGYTFSGNLLLPRHQLAALITFKKGDIFSRKAMMEVNKAMMQAFGEKGYANANIDVIPKMNDENHTVFLNFQITPGPRIYVHHILFENNYRTNDEVLRREVHQMEGGVVSTRQIESSKRSLMLLPFVSNAEASTRPVAGKDNQVDVDYKVTEVPAAQFKAGIAYSQLEQFMFNAGVEQKNLFGTGNSLNLNFLYSNPSTALNLGYYNPYYTPSGIGRSVNFYTSHFDSSNINLSDYVTDNYGGAVGYNWPVTLNNSIQFGYGYENDTLKIGSSPSVELTTFINKHRRHFYQINLNGGWTYQGLDRYLFPTNGLLQTFNLMTSVPISQESLRYYTMEASSIYYRPLYRNFIGLLKGIVGYGNGYGSYGGEMPFFKNFYAGGIGSVRGFEGNTLGPRDSKNNPLGGNFKLVGSAALIVPNPIGDTVRTSLFVDAGNVFNTRKNASGDGGINLNELRYSTGLQVDWRSPIALLSFSLATPLHKRDGDNAEWFQFNIGSSI